MEDAAGVAWFATLAKLVFVTGLPVLSASSAIYAEEPERLYFDETSARHIPARQAQMPQWMTAEQRNNGKGTVRR